ncbi:MAG: hypothetical protein AAB257_07650 [Nitrospinota bacterium]|jgi:hypothetical protein
MKEIEMEEKIHFIEKELDVLADGIENSKLSLKAEVDELKIEIESIKSYLKEASPDFKKRFQKIRDKIIQEKNPEWISNESED